MIAVILRWSCDDALEIGTFDLNLPNAERRTKQRRKEGRGEHHYATLGEPPFAWVRMRSKEQKAKAQKNKVTVGPEILRTSIMEQVSRLDALQTDIPCYLPNSFAIGQPVQDAPLVRATS